MTTVLEAAIARVEAAGAARPCCVCKTAARLPTSSYCRECATEHQHQMRLQKRRERMEAALSALVACQAQVNGDDCEEDAREGYRTCAAHAPSFFPGPVRKLKLVPLLSRAIAPLPPGMTLDPLPPLDVRDYIYSGERSGF